MRVFLDTNVLLSAALWPNGVAASCYRAVFTHQEVIVISDYVLSEVREVAARKFPDRMAAIDEFINAMIPSVLLVTTPAEPDTDEASIRDHDDRPVLRGARVAGCVLLITGDKDLLEAGVESPEIIKPADYLARPTRTL